MLVYIFIFFVTFLYTEELTEDFSNYLKVYIDSNESIKSDLKNIKSFPMQGGSFINSVYLVTLSNDEELVLKIENSNWNREKTVNEVYALKYLEQKSILTPKIVMYSFDKELRSKGYEFILMERLNGVPLNHLIDEIYTDKKRYSTLLESIAKTIAKFRCIKFGSLGSWKESPNLENLNNLEIHPNLIGNIVDFSGYEVKDPMHNFSAYAIHWVKYYKSELEKYIENNHEFKKSYEDCLQSINDLLIKFDWSLLNDVNETFVYSHLDFVMKNLLVKNDKISGVLDWEWSGIAPAEFESMSGFDFLFTKEDKELFNKILINHGVIDFFKEPKAIRKKFYDLIGDLYSIISCCEWRTKKFIHTARFMVQKLEQRRFKAEENINIEVYISEKIISLDKNISLLLNEGEYNDKNINAKCANSANNTS